MRLDYLWKDTGSGGGGCPALYGASDDDGTAGWCVQGKVPAARRDEPGFFVYGRPLAADERAQLINLLPDEDAVWVPDLAAAVDDREGLRAARPGEIVVWVPANVLDMSRTPERA